jgi:hypothetical protein
MHSGDSRRTQSGADIKSLRVIPKLDRANSFSIYASLLAGPQ